MQYFWCTERLLRLLLYQQISLGLRQHGTARCREREILCRVSIRPSPVPWVPYNPASADLEALHGHVGLPWRVYCVQRPTRLDRIVLPAAPPGEQSGCP
jgi:hypothetical protein